MLAIDPGYRNFAWCVIDNLDWRTPRVWQREDLWAGRGGKPTRNQLYAELQAWCVRNTWQLRAATHVVMESQMRKLFIALEGFLAGKCHAKLCIVHPTAVGRWWQLPTTRERKKLAGVGRVLEAGMRFPVNDDKTDDLADAWMMAVRTLVDQGGVALAQAFPRKIKY